MTDDSHFEPGGPADQRGERPPVRQIAREVGKEFSEDDVPGIAAEIAYHLLFAIPPMLIFIIAMAAVINNFTDVPVADNLIDLIEDNAPAEMQELLLNLVDRAVEQVSGAAAFGLLSSSVIALWSASNGVAALMKAFNRAYDVKERRSFIRQKLVAIGLTVLMSVLVIAAFALFVFGEQIGKLIADQAGLGDAFVSTWQVLRWPMAIVFIMFLLAVLYYLGPNIEQSFRWISPGSVLATILWVGIVFGFSLYLNIADPGSAYGAVGSVVVLLFFLFLTGVAFVTGAELNAVLAKRYDPETVADLAENPDKAEDAEAAAIAQQRRRGLRRRERRERETAPRDDASTGAASAAPALARSQEPRPAEQKPGLVERLVVGVAALGLAFVVSKFRKPGRG